MGTASLLSAQVDREVLKASVANLDRAAGIATQLEARQAAMNAALAAFGVAHEWNGTEIRFRLPTGAWGDWTDIGGPRGEAAWTWRPAIVIDGTRRVLRVADWIGGEGEKPVTGLYVGNGGLVADIASAIDIRGPRGLGSAPWIVVTANRVAEPGERLLVDTTGGPITVTLPPSPVEGDEVWIADAKESFADNNLTIARNGSTFDGTAEDLVVAIPDAELHLIFKNSTWRY